MPQVARVVENQAQRQLTEELYILFASYCSRSLRWGSPPALVLGWWPHTIVLVLARVGSVVGHGPNKKHKKNNTSFKDNF